MQALREDLQGVREALRRLYVARRTLAKNALRQDGLWLGILRKAVNLNFHQDPELVRAPFQNLTSATLTVGWEKEEEGVNERLRLTLVGDTGRDTPEEAWITILRDGNESLEHLFEGIYETWGLTESDLDDLVEAVVLRGAGKRVLLAISSFGEEAP